MTDDADRIPVMPRGTRCHSDKVRGVNVLLGPERTLVLDDIGNAILTELDGTRSVARIGADLAARYGAPETSVTADVTVFLRDLADKRLVDLHDV